MFSEVGESAQLILTVLPAGGITVESSSSFGPPKLGFGGLALACAKVLAAPARILLISLQKSLLRLAVALLSTRSRHVINRSQ